MPLWWVSAGYNYPRTEAETYLPKTVATLYCPANLTPLNISCQSNGTWTPNPHLEICPEGKELTINTQI